MSLVGRGGTSPGADRTCGCRRRWRADRRGGAGSRGGAVRGRRSNQEALRSGTRASRQPLHQVRRRALSPSRAPPVPGDVVTTDELFWRGPVEVAEELGSLPVRIHGGGRVFDPSLYCDLREHVPACRDLEKTRLRSWRFGQGRGEFEYAGAERVRVGLGRRDPTGPLLQELRKGAYDLESSAGVEAGTETLLPYRQLPLQAGSR